MIAEQLPPLLYMLAAIAKRAVLVHRSLRLHLVKLTGTTRNGKSDTVIYYLGEMETLGYLKRLYFAEVCEQPLDLFWLWELREKLRDYSSSDDLVIVEANRFFDFHAPGGGFHTFPWIRQIASMGPSVDGHRWKRIEDIYGRKVRQYQYRMDIRNDRTSVAQFYHDFYRPYIYYKYKNIAHVRDLQELILAASKGFLMQVFEGDRWISGVICIVRGGKLTILAKGLLPDYEYHLKRGAMSACDYFMFNWAREHGMETVDFLRSRPHAEDGLFEYKRKWGARAVRDVWPHTSLWVYLPKRELIPEEFKRQLVLDGQAFVELKTLHLQSHWQDKKRGLPGVDG
ncbi:MAG: GNAT family N-acetyltransferase [Pseudomonadota bacterium]